MHRTFQDFLLKLQDHLVPRLKFTLAQESVALESDASHEEEIGTNGIQLDRDLMFKSERIYLHNIVRIQFTTYDVRRGQDVINPSTPHRDVMLLATTDSNADHPFLYARVLGIYHANVVYATDGACNYQTKRFEFLWVRWYKYHGQSVRWNDSRLDALSFASVTTEGSFGFVDPSDVLRGCHIIPAFARGKKYDHDDDLSRIAKDSQDWSQYYVNRCVLLISLRH